MWNRHNMIGLAFLERESGYRSTFSRAAIAHHALQTAELLDLPEVELQDEKSERVF